MDALRSEKVKKTWNTMAFIEQHMIKANQKPEKINWINPSQQIVYLI